MITSTEDTAVGSYDSVISVSDLKEHLRVTHSDEDTLIGAYRDAAITFIEAYCNTRLIGGTVKFRASGFSAQIELPIGPVTRVTSIQYRTAKAGTLLTLDAREYSVERHRQPAVVRFVSVPSTAPEEVAPVEITADVGHATTPKSLVHAVRLLVGHFYEHRQAAEAASIREVPMGLYSLINPYRVVSFI